MVPRATMIMAVYLFALTAAAAPNAAHDRAAELEAKVTQFDGAVSALMDLCENVPKDATEASLAPTVWRLVGRVVATAQELLRVHGVTVKPSETQLQILADDTSELGRFAARIGTPAGIQVIYDPAARCLVPSMRAAFDPQQFRLLLSNDAVRIGGVGSSEAHEFVHAVATYGEMEGITGPFTGGVFATGGIKLFEPGQAYGAGYDFSEVLAFAYQLWRDAAALTRIRGSLVSGGAVDARQLSRTLYAASTHLLENEDLPGAHLTESTARFADHMIGQLTQRRTIAGKPRHAEMGHAVFLDFPDAGVVHFAIGFQLLSRARIKTQTLVAMYDNQAGLALTLRLSAQTETHALFSLLARAAPDSDLAPLKQSAEGPILDRLSKLGVACQQVLLATHGLYSEANWFYSYVVSLPPDVLNQKQGRGQVAAAVERVMWANEKLRLALKPYIMTWL